jgi:hypothetical protein
MESSRGVSLFNIDNIFLIQKCDAEDKIGEISYRIEICCSIGQTGICKFESKELRDSEFEKIENILSIVRK